MKTSEIALHLARNSESEVYQGVLWRVCRRNLPGRAHTCGCSRRTLQRLGHEEYGLLRRDVKIWTIKLCDRQHLRCSHTFTTILELRKHIFVFDHDVVNYHVAQAGPFRVGGQKVRSRRVTDDVHCPHIYEAHDIFFLKRLSGAQ